MKSWFLVFVFVVSPIWPLGPQPVVGDPFLIVKKETLELAYFEHGRMESVFHVATGHRKTETPEGLFTITVKAKEPYYRKKDIPGGDPNNPLGTRWLGFDAAGTDGRIYGVHGTNRPETIGLNVTNGCIRLTNDHVEHLFTRVPLGTKILITSRKESFESLAKEYGAIK